MIKTILGNFIMQKTSLNDSIFNKLPKVKSFTTRDKIKLIKSISTKFYMEAYITLPINIYDI